MGSRTPSGHYDLMTPYELLLLCTIVTSITWFLISAANNSATLIKSVLDNDPCLGVVTRGYRGGVLPRLAEHGKLEICLSFNTPLTDIILKHKTNIHTARQKQEQHLTTDSARPDQHCSRKTLASKKHSTQTHMSSALIQH